MSRALLDVNVLLALLDSDHLHHHRVTAWLPSGLVDGWSSCPITENGFVRILSQPRYPNPVSPTRALDLLTAAQAGGPHEFWPCDLSLLDPEVLDRTRLHGARQVTDSYLLALAVSRGGRLVTFDRSIVLESVPGARADDLEVL